MTRLHLGGRTLIPSPNPNAIFDTEKKETGLNFEPQSPDLIGTSPDTSPDVSVFPYFLEPEKVNGPRELIH